MLSNRLKTQQIKSAVTQKENDRIALLRGWYANRKNTIHYLEDGMRTEKIPYT